MKNGSLNLEHPIVASMLGNFRGHEWYGERNS